MSTDDPEDLERQFWNQVAAFEGETARSLFVVLPETGVALPSPDELDDAQLDRKLWEVIHALAQLGTYLHNTNHLSDRELYTALWQDLLREPVVLMPESPDYSCHLDMIGSGSEEHMFLFMKYYAGEDDRRSWLKDWPEDRLPDPEEPPFHRDHLLPQREFRADEPVM